MKEIILLIAFPVLLLSNSSGGMDFQDWGRIAFESFSQIIVSNRGFASNISQIDAQGRCQSHKKDAKHECYTELRYILSLLNQNNYFN